MALERLFLPSLLIIGFIVSSWSCVQSENILSPPILTIPQGTLIGKTVTTRYNRKVSAFHRIPYAKPPTGNLRFANPVPADGWIGFRNAAIDTSICPQILGGIKLGKEDCLYLNVYTPKLPGNGNSTLLPVMVFIYGGTFVNGAANPIIYGPKYLLDKDVVLVVPNYRLGPLGFLSTGDAAASGNWGLKDQVLALKWVQNNIKHFGGDADQVTLFGESAGSMSVHILALSKAATGLFHRYITQSGSALSPSAYAPRKLYANRAFELGNYVGCSNISTTTSLINCLRTVRVSDILSAYPKFNKWHSYPQVWATTDEPDIEGAILTDSPVNLFNNGQISDLPWMVGDVRDEGLLITAEFYENEAMLDDFLEHFDHLLPYLLSWTYKSNSAAMVSAAKSFYFNNDLTMKKELLLANLTRLVSDARYIYPTYSALQQQFALAVYPQYPYTFDFRGTRSYTYFYTGATKNYGVAHADDLIYLFPSYLLFRGLKTCLTKNDYKMVDNMVQLWTSFAIDGKPTASALGTMSWDRYSKNDNYLQIGNELDVGLRVKNGFYVERMRFWADLVNSAPKF